MSKDEESDLKALIDSRVQRELELERATVAKNEAKWKIDNFLYKLANK